MTTKTLYTGIAVVIALAVIALFFVFGGYNPFNMSGTTSGATQVSAQDEVVGTGAVAQAGDQLTVNYTGKFANGTVFDTSLGKQPYVFTLGAGQVIQGWDVGLVGMKEGGKRILIIPPSLAYGSQDYGPIPANSTLTFEVELLKVTPASGAVTPEGPAAQ